MPPAPLPPHQQLSVTRPLLEHSRQRKKVLAPARGWNGGKDRKERRSERRGVGGGGGGADGGRNLKCSLASLFILALEDK